QTKERKNIWNPIRAVRPRQTHSLFPSLSLSLSPYFLCFNSAVHLSLSQRGDKGRRGGRESGGRERRGRDILSWEFSVYFLHTHTHTHKCTQVHIHSLFCTHTLMHTNTHTLSLSHTHKYTYSLSLAHAHILHK